MEITPAFLVLVPVVLGVVQAIKKIGLASKWSPLVSIALGIAGAYALGGFTSLNIIQGIVVGLSASGLWSGSKATLGLS